MVYSNLKEFAQAQNVSVHTVRRWVRKGLPHTKASKLGKILIEVEKAESWLFQYKAKRDQEGLSFQQAADVAGVHRKTIRNWLKSNVEFREVVMIRGKTSYLISKQELEKWLINQNSKRTKGES